MFTALVSVHTNESTLWTANTWIGSFLSLLSFFPPFLHTYIYIFLASFLFIFLFSFPFSFLLAYYSVIIYLYSLFVNLLYFSYFFCLALSYFLLIFFININIIVIIYLLLRTTSDSTLWTNCSNMWVGSFLRSIFFFLHFLKHILAFLFFVLVC